MVTAINTQALGGAVAGGASADRAEPPAREIQTTDELQAVVVKISAEGARRAEASAQAAPAAQEPPVRLDGDANGQVIPQQVQVSEPSVAQAGAGSAAPAGGQAPAVTIGDSGAVSRTSQTYEPADTDEDGTVTPQERQTYETKLADEKAAAQAADSARSAEADAALKAYEVVEQLGAAG